MSLTQQDDDWCHDRARELVLNKGKANVQYGDITNVVTADYQREDPDAELQNRINELVLASSVEVTFAN